MKPSLQHLGSALLAALLVLCLPQIGIPQEAAERLLLEAERRERQGDLASALTDYEMVARQFPGTQVAGRALLRLVAGKRSRGDLDGAVEACNRLIDDFPGTSWAAAGLFYMGEMQLERARKRSETEDARETFRRIYVLFDPLTHPDLVYRAAARVRDAELDLRAGDIEGAELSYLATLEGEPRSEWTMHARLGLAGIYLERGDWMLAAETLQQAINEAVDLGYEEVAEEARIELTLVHRLMLRPAAGAARWQQGRQLRGLGLNRKPAGVAATGDGRIVVTEEYPGRAVLLAGETVIANRTYPEAYRPFFTRDGSAWVPSTTVLYEVEGGNRRTYLGPSRSPTKNIESGAEGIYQWFTIEAKPQRILTHREDSPVDRQVQARDPVDLATDSQGRLYVLEEGGTLLRFSSGLDSSTRLVTSGITDPLRVDVDPMGNVYVLEESGRLHVFDTGGKELDSLGPSFPGGVSVTNPVDVAVDDTGRIYLLSDKPAALYVLE